MRYHRLHINHFGRLQNVTMTFSEGLNVIQTPKSCDEESLHAFLEAMQFGIDRGEGNQEANHIYRKYFPESGSSTYSGVLEFETADTTFSIYRNFFRDPYGYTLMDETHNKSLNLNAEEYRNLIQHMTLPLYRNTIDRVPSVSCDEAVSPARVTDYMNNLCESGSASLDLTLARRRLLEQRTSLEASYSHTTDERDAALSRAISQLSLERDKYPDASELSVWEKQLETATREIEAMQSEREALEEEIQNEEQYLEVYAATSGAALRDAENRCQRLLDRRSRLLKQYPDPASNPLRQAYPALVGISGIAVLIGIVLAILFFVRGNTSIGITGLVIAAAGGILCYRFMKQIQALNAFRYVDRSLRKLYADVLPEIPEQIDQKSMDDFLALMQDLRQRRSKLQRDHRKAESTASRIYTLQENRERIVARREARKKEFREKIQLDEKITRLMDEREALLPVLDHNQSLTADMDALDLAIQTIDRLSSEAFREHSAFIQASASQYLSKMTAGRCDVLRRTADRSILVDQNKTTCTLDRVSESTRKQILLSLRLASILALNTEEPLPLLLDRSFIPTEEEAFLETMSWLTSSYPGQILLFAENGREASLLEQANIEKEIVLL